MSHLLLQESDVPVQRTGIFTKLNSTLKIIKVAGKCSSLKPNKMYFFESLWMKAFICRIDVSFRRNFLCEKLNVVENINFNAIKHSYKFPSVKHISDCCHLVFHLPRFASVMDPDQCHRKWILKNSDLNRSFVDTSENTGVLISP
jgi:hypothetical protein